MDQLDRLVDLVGELVTVRSRLADLGERHSLEALGDGLDRLILDSLHEPLVHLIRNALGHGLESPAARQAAGKAAAGSLTLSARRDREHVVVAIADDGRGMDAEAIRGAAVDRGILTGEEAALLTETQALLLVCEPGFSTATQVTELSGRGVGMDVVKQAVESVGGSMEICSTPGEGTVFELHLPVTLAIIRVLLVRVGAERYALPLSNVTEAVNYADVDLRTVGSREVALLRETVLPLVHLRQLLELAEAPTDGSRRLLALEVGSQRVGVVVDGVIRQQEVVIKPLDGLLRQLRGFAGATVLGDGRVVPVLDPASLVATYA